MSTTPEQPQAEKPKGHSNRIIKYVCSDCKRTRERSDLLAKRVTFTTLRPVKIIRSRTVGWVCSECREKDPAWTQPRLVDAPGYADTKFAEHE